MRKITIIILMISSMKAVAQEKFQTVFENSNGQSTATFEEVINFYQQLAKEYKEISIEEKGDTDAGIPLHLVKISSGEGPKLRMLINNGIHPGEPDGIDASMMLARDLVKSKNRLLQHFNIYIIPVYNIGGALNRNSTTRVNQNGPESHGFRGNARNYDLNRDFLKADTKNTRSFYQIFHEVQPDIFIDTHVSNGADYQYNNTHLFTQHNKLNSRTGNFLYEKFIPATEKSMSEKNDPMTPYVNVFNRTPDSGFSQFMDWPRYSTGYAALFNTLGMMIETHMLKDYQTRVKSTYTFLTSALENGVNFKKELLDLRKDNSWWPGETYPLSWKLNENKADTIKFLGYEGITEKSMVTGLDRLRYEHTRPFEKNIPYYNHFDPDLLVEVPDAYVVPQGWHNIIDLLLLNNIEFDRLVKDTTIQVEVYRIEDFETSSRPYEGHYPHNKISIKKEIQQVNLRKGDYIFPVHQRAGRYLIEALEPQAHDSFFSWNFFDTILQRKEGFSPYVFEELAYKILQENPELKTAFEKKRQEDADFRENGYTQLKYIYENSEYSEGSYYKYPIYRIVQRK